jgi:predicted Zn-dependent peptidase
MKTAMQELMEYLDETIPKSIKEKYLEKEKEQIIEVWIATDNQLQRLAAEEYYNQTYNQNK